MFSHPYISGELGRQRHHDLLASAQQHRLARQLARQPGLSRRAGPVRQLLRALRPAAARLSGNAA
jgi:hypothetical protein